jgi:hypothetical protein
MSTDDRDPFRLFRKVGSFFGGGYAKNYFHDRYSGSGREAESSIYI